MTLPIGTRLGPYEILAPQGAGGMGEVYRAADTRLNRTVAIKVLPAAVADNPDRRQRFEREARAVAGLTHPHICALHDVGREGDVEFLVMEFIEGETLEQRMMAGALPVADALRYAIDIADALDHAHRKGIVHRDLKPSNVMVTKSGAQVLDFGLAKASAVDPIVQVSPAPTMPTGTKTLTAEGIILGTLQYMAPEQLEGRAADARADIFAFGAVVYEMLTGQKAFGGASQASVVAAILRADPPALSAIQPVLPAALDRVVRRCLAKDPDDRWQTARDLMSELAWIRENISQAAMFQPPADRRGGLHWIGWIAAAAGLVIAAVATVVLVLMYVRRPIQEAAPIQFTVAAPETTTFLESPAAMAVSPDGRHLAFVALTPDGKELLWVRSLESVAARELAGTEGARAPFWSPDSQGIGFFAKHTLKTIDVSGSNLRTLCETESFVGGGAWNRDGVILFSVGPVRMGLVRVPVTGGTPTAATKLDPSRAEILHSWPVFLPDGRHFLYRSWSDKKEYTGIYVGSVDSPDRTLLVHADASPAYAAPGYFIYGTNGTLLAQALDPSSYRLKGEPLTLVQNVAFNNGSGRSAFSTSTSASDAAVLTYRQAGLTELGWFDRSGRALGVVGPPGRYLDPSLSPDGQQVAVVRVDPDLGTSDIWLIDVAGGSASHLTSGHTDRCPIWSPDGRFIAFASKRGGAFDVFQAPSSRTSGDEPVLNGHKAFPVDWSRDGESLLFQPESLEKPGVLPLRGDAKRTSLQGPPDMTQLRLSPDGRWIAYVSRETGQDEVYVCPFPTAEGRAKMISVGGGVEPKWRRDGKELFYLARNRNLMTVSMTSGDTLTAGPPRALFMTRARISRTMYAGRNQYDVTADGQRFLMNVPVEAASTPITVVVNWPAALRR
jgi:Tol biopolymer transport system component